MRGVVIFGIACTIAGCGPADIGEEPNPGVALPDRNAADPSGTTTATPPPPPASSNVKITVNLTGTGTGTISSTPAGVSCAVNTCTGTFPSGTAVTLAATPGSGAIFAGFSGACSGATCAPTLTSDLTVGAEFDTPAGTWSGTYTHSQTVSGCTFNNKGNLSTTISAALSSTANITGLELRQIPGCNLVSTTTGSAPASNVTVVGSQVTGTWTFNVQGANGSLPLPFKGTIAGKTITGSWTCTGCTGSFTLTRQ